MLVLLQVPGMYTKAYFTSTLESIDKGTGGIYDDNQRFGFERRKQEFTKNGESKSK